MSRVIGTHQRVPTPIENDGLLLRPNSNLIKGKQGASKVIVNAEEVCISPQQTKEPSTTKAHLDNNFQYFIQERNSNAFNYDSVTNNDDEEISD